MLAPLAHWRPLGAHSLGETSGQESVTYLLASLLFKLKDNLCFHCAWKRSMEAWKL